MSEVERQLERNEEHEPYLPQPRTAAGRALLTELTESPLPGARYAWDVVSRRLPKIEAEAAADAFATLEVRIRQHQADTADERRRVEALRDVDRWFVGTMTADAAMEAVCSLGRAIVADAKKEAFAHLEARIRQQTRDAAVAAGYADGGNVPPARPTLDAPDPQGIDVERLARALKSAYDQDAFPSFDWGVDAHLIAVEYDRLTGDER